MTKLWAILMGVLLALSFGVGSVVHAMEPVTCIDDATAVSAHAGETPAPADNSKGDVAMHAHGSCHGHHLATPTVQAMPCDMILIKSLRSMRVSSALAAIEAERTLRPPIA